MELPDDKTSVLVDDNLSPSRYKRLETYIRLSVTGTEHPTPTFTREYIHNYRKYLRVVCSKSAYGFIKRALDNAPNVSTDKLWENVKLRFNPEEIELKMYFEVFFDSFVEDHKVVKEIIQSQNPKIDINSWVFARYDKPSVYFE